MTDADVSLDGEGEGQPDARVTGGVGQRAPERQPVVLVGRRATDGRVVVESHRQREDQVEDVVDGQRRQVAVGRRLHRPARQHGHVHQVAADSEQHDRRYEQLLNDESRHVQLTTKLVQVVDDSVHFHRRRRRRHHRAPVSCHRYKLLAQMIDVIQFSSFRCLLVLEHVASAQ